MDKLIGSLATKKVVVVDLDERINKVIETLDSHNLSCVPVIDSDGKCFGVISSPDLVHFQKMNLNPKAELAWEFCTHNFIEVGSATPIKDVAELMIKNKIHHIIVSDKTLLKGIVSSIDIIEHFLLK
jgi:CBS domain-containing protein